MAERERKIELLRKQHKEYYATNYVSKLPLKLREYANK